MPDTEPESSGEGDPGVLAGADQHAPAQLREQFGTARRGRDGRIEGLASGHRAGGEGGAQGASRAAGDGDYPTENRVRQAYVERLGDERGGAGIQPQLSRPEDQAVRSQAPLVPLRAADEQDVQIFPQGRHEDRPEQVERCRAFPVEVLGAFHDDNRWLLRHRPQRGAQQPVGLSPVASAALPGSGLGDPGRGGRVEPAESTKQR